MRFNIRDLLWLMVVVGAVATFCTLRVELRKKTAQWQAEKARLQEDFAAERQKLSNDVKRLEHDNTFLRGQIHARLQEDLQREMAQTDRRRQSHSPYHVPFSSAPPIENP